jgi:hypothetical protein
MVASTKARAKPAVLCRRLSSCAQMRDPTGGRTVVVVVTTVVVVVEPGIGHPSRLIVPSMRAIAAAPRPPPIAPACRRAVSRRAQIADPREGTVVDDVVVVEEVDDDVDVVDGATVVEELDVVVGPLASGPQFGSVSAAGTSLTSLVIPVPSGFTVNRSGPFGAPKICELEENTILVPSGDHAGFVPLVTNLV